MSQLPPLLRKLPYLFYAFALILGGWRFLNEWIVLESTYNSMGGQFGDEPFNLVHSVGRSAAVYWAVAEAIYIVAYGAMLQVLIAIFDKMKGPGE